jgi:hypothetical protein
MPLKLIMPGDFAMIRQPLQAKISRVHGAFQFGQIILDGFVKSRKTSFLVTPVITVTQYYQ